MFPSLDIYELSVQCQWVNQTIDDNVHHSKTFMDKIPTRKHHRLTRYLLKSHF